MAKKLALIKAIYLILLVGLDQTVKFLAIKSNNFFYNNYGFLGWGRKFNYWPYLGFILLSLIIVYWFFIKKQIAFFKYLGFTFLISGGMSNLLDIFCRQGIVDFIDLKFWPVFNLADVFIFFGTFLILNKSNP